MKDLYVNKYYDHFSKKVFSDAPVFSTEKNYMMRFNTPLKSYAYDENNLTIIYFNKGCGSVEWINKHQRINDDSFIVTNPSEGWNYLNERGKCIDVLSIVVSKELKTQFDTFYFSNKAFLLDNPFEIKSDKHFFIEKALLAEYYPCGKLLKQIYRESFNTDFDTLDAEELAITLLNSLHKNQYSAYRFANHIEVRKQSTKIETLKRLLTAREYIHDNLYKKITLDELSAISCLSKFHLYNSFKKVFGKTPHQYINFIKLHKAKELLIHNNYSIGEISTLLGYNDIHCFSKLFKKAFKVSPSQYS